MIAVWSKGAGPLRPAFEGPGGNTLTHVSQEATHRLSQGGGSPGA
jgi:hypothetical protein